MCFRRECSVIHSEPRSGCRATRIVILSEAKDLRIFARDLQPQGARRCRATNSTVILSEPGSPATGLRRWGGKRRTSAFLPRKSISVGVEEPAALSLGRGAGLQPGAPFKPSFGLSGMKVLSSRPKFSPQARTKRRDLLFSPFTKPCHPDRSRGTCRVAFWSRSAKL